MNFVLLPRRQVLSARYGLFWCLIIYLFHKNIEVGKNPWRLFSPAGSVYIRLEEPEHWERWIDAPGFRPIDWDYKMHLELGTPTLSLNSLCFFSFKHFSKPLLGFSPPFFLWFLSFFLPSLSIFWLLFFNRTPIPTIHIVSLKTVLSFESTVFYPLSIFNDSDISTSGRFLKLYEKLAGLSKRCYGTCHGDLKHPS